MLIAGSSSATVRDRKCVQYQYRSQERERDPFVTKQTPPVRVIRVYGIFNCFFDPYLSTSVATAVERSKVPVRTNLEQWPIQGEHRVMTPLKLGLCVIVVMELEPVLTEPLTNFMPRRSHRIVGTSPHSRFVTALVTTVVGSRQRTLDQHGGLKVGSGEWQAATAVGPRRRPSPWSDKDEKQEHHVRPSGAAARAPRPPTRPRRQRYRAFLASFSRPRSRTAHHCEPHRPPGPARIRVSDNFTHTGIVCCSGVCYKCPRWRAAPSARSRRSCAPAKAAPAATPPPRPPRTPPKTTTCRSARSGGITTVLSALFSPKILAPT
ncbi:hypothetical protein EVAR_95181_1 [Eumeta japonica]|uniref:Uncharacterized protein n=1 Tax=Eumeta variegata TaxID=151549 RepID=A0A4C1VK15_EUMVA|nr:hypothetical protein EVAR_95181_1 [Eumeta japonica]